MIAREEKEAGPMRLPRRDVVATCAVAAAVVLYLLWLLDAALPGMSSVRVTGLAVLVLGFIASAAAVVPGFEALVHGNRTYLAVTAALGTVALVAGIAMLSTAGAGALAVLTAVLVLLWAIATTHHVRLARAASCPDCGSPVHESYCDVCGYDLVRETQDEVAAHRIPM